MRGLVYGILVGLLLLVFAGIAMAAPNGASTVTSVSNSTAGTDSPANNSAIAGNVSEITITGFSTTQAWQGYFGNVSGSIELANAAGNTLYNWSITNPAGEVYASTAGSIAWGSVACFNVTADAAALESTYNVGVSDADGVNETFNAQNHDGFYTNSIQFAANDCYSVQLYDSTGGSTDGTFEEVILTADGGTTPIFTSILEDTSVSGFDSKDHDFEMLVIEDGHGTDTDTTQYYFYVELE